MNNLKNCSGRGGVKNNREVFIDLPMKFIVVIAHNHAL